MRAQCPYHAIDDVGVLENVKLIIQAGVEVVFKQAADAGSISVRGLRDAPVRFSGDHQNSIC
jgi:hypothetical protein